MPSRITLSLLVFSIITLAGCTTSSLPDTQYPDTTIDISSWTTNTTAWTSDKAENTIETPDTTEEDTAPSYVDYTISTFVSDLQVPRGMALLDDETMLVTQRNWDILRISSWHAEIFDRIPEVRSVEEAGLMGIALDPDYADNRHIYLSVTVPGHLHILRYTTSDRGLIDKHLLFEIPQIAAYHAGWAIAFWPDDKLYFSMGDATQSSQAQSLDSHLGKLLRINPDGSIPSDNPFEKSAIWSLGHRNIQGIDWTSDGTLIVSEHGPTAWFDGKAWGDEINIIQPGENYGWPIVSHDEHEEGMIDPLITYTPALAPSGLIIYQGDLFPQWHWKILVAWLVGTRIVVIDPNSGVEEEILMKDDYGRLRALAQNSLWEIFVTSSNRDGRGSAQDWDDRIYKITASTQDNSEDID